MDRVLIRGGRERIMEQCKTGIKVRKSKSHVVP